MSADRARHPTTSAEPHSGRDSVVAANLPQALTSFVGRADQVAAVSVQLRDPEVRLLTLAGPGGVGKTRLAIAAAVEVAADFDDGVHFVPCAELREPAQAPYAIAETLDLQTGSGESIEARVVRYVRDRELLLVLDNLEHILPISFISRLLTACPRARILATSRTLLHLSGEHEYVVQPMTVPDPERALSVDDLSAIESMELLASRVRQVDPSFEVTRQNVVQLAAICTRLDGLPLAIELAAARLKVFAPITLLDRLSDRLSVLTGGPSDKPPHQRTVRGTLDWSHDLLSPREQRLFRRLAVFTGRITPAAAASICRECDGDHDGPASDIEALDELIGLADQSLLQQTARPDELPSFSMLETVRHFALEQLELSGEMPGMRQRHAEFYLALVERANDGLSGVEQVSCRRLLDAEQPNIRAALKTFREAGKVERYTELACSLFKYWRMRGKQIEGSRWLDVTVDPSWQAQLPEDLRSKALTAAGWMELERGDTDTARSLAECALSIAVRIENHDRIASAHGVLSLVAYRLVDHETAIPHMEASLYHHREAGNAVGVAGMLNNLAVVSMESGDFARAAEACAESRDAFMEIGNLHGAAHGINNRGVALYCLGEIDEAMRCSHDALAIYRDLGDSRGTAHALGHIGKCARAQGDLAGAWRAHAEGLPYRRDVGDPRGLVVWLEGMARWMADAGCADIAARALGATETARTSSNIPIQIHEAGDREATEALAHERLGRDQFEAEVAKGRWLTLDEAVSEISEVAERRAGELESGPAPAPDPLADAYGLTPREREVLGMIVQRYANKEIADALYISPRTVARHVTSIFNKLGVNSRREAATRVNGTDPS